MKILVLCLTFVLASCVHQSVDKAKSWNAQEYRNNSLSQMQAAHHALERLMLRGQEHVLDIGCGDGKITARIAEKVVDGRVLGIDLSQTMIDFALHNFSDRSNLRFQRMDASDINFSDDFDLVASFSTFQWIADQAKVFGKVHHALKARGTFLMTIPAGYPLALQRSLDEMMADQNWRGFFTQFKLGQVFHSPREYEKMLRDQGFSSVLVEEIPAFDRFETIDAFKSFVRQWLPHLTRVPPQRHEAFLTGLMNYYEKHQAREADGSIWFNKFSIEAVAKKI